MPMSGTGLVTGVVPMRMVPRLGASRPAIRRSRVLFPQPDGPTMLTASPARNSTLSGAITYANDAYLSLLGYTREDLEAGQINWEQVTRQEGHSLDEKAFAEMRDTGACTPFERQFIRKDGQPTSLLFGAALLEGSKNKIVCFALDLSRYK